MNKADRDKLRRILEFHPGEVVPIPGTDTIVELLDQIDEFEKSQRALEEQVNLANMYSLSQIIKGYISHKKENISHEESLSPR